MADRPTPSADEREPVVITDKRRIDRDGAASADPAGPAAGSTEPAVEPGQGRLSTWSPEARAGTPLLPDLSPDAEAPLCLRTVRDGVTIFDALG